MVEAGQALCRFDDPEYKEPASYDDLLSYYNQRDHKIIDRHLIQDALEKLRICTIEIQTNTGFKSYEDQYQSLLRNLDPTPRLSANSSSISTTTACACPMRPRSGSMASTSSPISITSRASGCSVTAPRTTNQQSKQTMKPSARPSWRAATRSGSITTRTIWPTKVAAASRHFQEGPLMELAQSFLQPGKLVSLRGRDWIVLPSDDPDLLVVKPLGGSDDEITGIYLPLAIDGRPTS